MKRTKPAARRSWRQDFKRTWMLYLFLLPAFIYLVIFNYAPMYGVQIAFRNYNALDGVWGSTWVGMTHFVKFVQSYQFWDLLRNTLIISIYSLVAGFPMPVIFALLLNNVTSKRYRKFSQMVTYAPHFISTVVFCGMIWVFLGSDGIINQIIMMLGGECCGASCQNRLFLNTFMYGLVCCSLWALAVLFTYRYLQRYLLSCMKPL